GPQTGQRPHARAHPPRPALPPPPHLATRPRHPHPHHPHRPRPHLQRRVRRHGGVGWHTRGVRPVQPAREPMRGGLVPPFPQNSLSATGAAIRQIEVAIERFPAPSLPSSTRSSNTGPGGHVQQPCTAVHPIPARPFPCCSCGRRCAACPDRSTTSPCSLGV